MKVLDTLNIAHVVFSFDYGGLERRILRLIESLSERHCRFQVVSLRHSDGRFLDSSLAVEHINVNANPGVDIRAINRIAKHFRENNIHIVHSHNWVSMLEGTLAAKLARTPVCVHGEHGEKRFEPSELVWRRTLSQRILCRLSDHIIPVNDSISRRIQDVWRLPQERLTTIRNGVDIGKFKPAMPKPTLGASVINVGSVSRLDPVKNFPCLIRAIALLNSASEGRKYHLTIIGGGDQLAELERLTASLGAESFVNFPGATDQAERCYPNFDIYVNSSFSEGMSNTVLEAMACGLPIVATDVSGHRDWLTEGEHAMFFRSDDAQDLASKIRYFGENEHARRKFAATNRSYIENEFGQRQFIERYKTLYRRLLEQKGYEFNFDR